MIYTLGTNAVAVILRDDPNLVERITSAVSRGDEVALSAMTYFETKRGLFLPTFRKKLEAFTSFADRFGVLRLDITALDVAARLYQDLRRKGTPLEDADTLIAGVAIAHDATLVTCNFKHFARIEDLRLESLFLKSWEA